jgi:hypothetical protein
LPAASAKDFDPGDLRICNATRCVAFVRRSLLRQLGSFYYGRSRLTPAVRPALGAPYFELRFTNGYVTGIVATKALNRFLSYGVYLERFHRDRWYAVPAALAREFRSLTARLRPLVLTTGALRKSR